MVGSAVATMVWSSAASSIPSTIATKIRLRRCGLISSLLDSAFAAGLAWVDAAVGLVMPAFRQRPMLTATPLLERLDARHAHPACEALRNYAIEPGGRETHCAKYSSSPSLSIS